MPRGDGTGPAGMGAMTGRRSGYCAGFNTPGYASNVGFGRGFGRGFRRMSYLEPNTGILESQLAEIKTRLAEIEEKIR